MTMTEHGADDLVAALSGIAAGLDDLHEASNETARIVVATARRMVPHRTGRLMMSIRGTGTGSTATIATNVPYALPVHFGVPGHNQKAQPFLLGALMREQPRIVDAYAANVAGLIEQKV